jgi:hypothetical protein
MEDISRIATRASSQDTATAPLRKPWQPAVLRMLRLMIDSYRAPERDGWCHALGHAQALWGEARGALVFADLAQVLVRMRTARQSPFGFGRTDAPQIAPTRHETLFLQVITLTLAGRPDRAEAVADLLCETNDCTEYLAAVRRLAARLG